MYQERRRINIHERQEESYSDDDDHEHYISEEQQEPPRRKTVARSPPRREPSRRRAPVQTTEDMYENRESVRENRDSVRENRSAVKTRRPVQEEPVQEEPVQEEPVQEEPMQKKPRQTRQEKTKETKDEADSEFIKENTYITILLSYLYYYVDVTSLYPFVCSERPFPKGDPLPLSIRRFNSKGYMKGRLFFVHVKVIQHRDTPGGNYYLPARRGVLSKDGRTRSTTVFENLDWVTPTEELDMWMPSPTYQDCLKNGYKVELVQDDDGYVGYYWEEKSFNVASYMDSLMAIKQEEDAKPYNERNHARREMAKLLLNAFTGKVIQRRFGYKENFYSSAASLLEEIAKMSDEQRDDITFTGLESGNAFVKMPKTPPEFAKVPAYIGVFIYAYARSYMWGTVFYHTPYVYTDTDSAVVPPEHYEKMEKAGLIGNKFGQFKTEGLFDKGIIAAPKVYLFENTGADEENLPIDRENARIEIENEKIDKENEVIDKKNEEIRDKSKHHQKEPRLVLTKRTIKTYARCKGVGAKDTFINKEGNKVTYKDHEPEFFELLMENSVPVTGFTFRKDIRADTWRRQAVTKMVSRKNTRGRFYDDLESRL